MKLAYFYVTDTGKNLANQLRREMPGDAFGKEQLKEQIGEAFIKYEGLVLIMASGIAVRMIAPYLVHKGSDPAVVVMDQRGQFAISLVSGHLGGANELAKMLAERSGGTAVITTATDVENCVAFDLFAKEADLAIENIEELKYLNGASQAKKKISLVLNGFDEIWTSYMKQYNFYDFHNFVYTDEIKTGCYVVIADGEEKVSSDADRHVLYLRPRIYSVGIGCKRGIAYEDLKSAMVSLLKQYQISWHCVKNLATIPLKSREPAILKLSETSGIPLCIIEEEKIQALDIDGLGIQKSGFVEQVTGVTSVSTACSYLASGRGQILVDKARFPGITLALSVARKNELWYDK